MVATCKVSVITRNMDFSKVRKSEFLQFSVSPGILKFGKLASPEIQIFQTSGLPHVWYLIRSVVK